MCQCHTAEIMLCILKTKQNCVPVSVAKHALLVYIQVFYVTWRCEFWNISLVSYKYRGAEKSRNNQWITFLFS